MRKRFYINGRPTPGLVVHAPYLKPASTLLAEAHQRAEPQGLQQLTLRQTLEDGARLEASIRFGQEEIRIDVPLPGDGPYSLAPLPERREPEIDDFYPYLWIGAKLVSGGLNEQGQVAAKIHLCVWEPGVRPDLSGPAEILSNRHRFVGTEPDTGIYPLQNNELVDDPAPDAVTPPGQQRPPQIALTPAKFYEKQNGKDPLDPESEWDEIAVADPADPYFPAKIRTGQYQIKLMMVGPDCPNITPSRVRLRVRVGRGKHAIVSEDEVEIAEVTNYKRGIAPLGWYDPWESQCSGVADNGPNVHAAHWWQGAALAFVPPLQVRVPADDLRRPSIAFKTSHVPRVGFADGEFPPKSERCVTHVKVLWGIEGSGQVSQQYCMGGGTRFKFCASTDMGELIAVYNVSPDSIEYAYLACGESTIANYQTHYSGIAPPTLPDTMPFKWVDSGGNEQGSGSVPMWTDPPHTGGTCPWYGGNWSISQPPTNTYAIATAYYRYDTNAWTILPGLVPADEVTEIIQAAVGGRVCVFSSVDGWAGCAA